MTPVDIRVGDATDRLREMFDKSVNCIVTSPPYWGLRDYGVDGQIGLEPTLPEFLDRLLTVFEQCHRVLADDGVMFVNMGDSYAGSRGSAPPSSSSTLQGNGHVGGGPKIRAMTESRRYDKAQVPRADYRVHGLKPKDMVGQPWRLAFALQDAGWYLRQDIIWHKPNPMPESTRDRCTKSHEYLFLLSKSERYHWDFESMQEPVSGTANARVAGWASGTGGHSTVEHNKGDRKFASKGVGVNHDNHGGAKPREKYNSSFDAACAGMVTTRNRRSVWTIQTEGNKDAHFATFPRALVRPCILAGCPAGGTVLDPFSGTGTTGVVALELGRKYIGIELNPEYAEMSRKRLAAITPGFDFETEAA